MFTIGEFSRISRLSIKTLRFYHEKGILVPSCVDERTGYRYYDRRNLDKARVVIQFRRMEFPVSQIKEILEQYNDESDILEYLRQQRDVLGRRLRECRDLVRSLDRIISQEQEAQTTMQDSDFEVQEKTLQPVLVAGVRIRGKYSECGKGFAQVARRFGRHVCGKAMCLYYDGEYREDDADFEACLPVRQGPSVEGISVRELPGGRCVALLHKGPYELLGRSYAKIMAYVKDHGYSVLLPTREVYLKGPGMFLRGNPKNYLTEIQILVGEDA
jgi:DNA-binding transcriptional MerR regulator